MNTIFLLLGSNEGKNKFFLLQALRLLGQKINIQRVSNVFKTEPWGVFEKSPGVFLNIAVKGRTHLPPKELLLFIKSIEKILGRKQTSGIQPRPYRSRPIDIDILFYNNEAFSARELTIPHIHIPHRRFVLRPLSQIAPNFRHPVLKKTVKELLKECPDSSKVVAA